MADDTDFLELYGKLRLRPDCTLDEFRLAYRRYVAHWHPDRRRGDRARALAKERLQELTAQYDAAIVFHRRHGRLPGGAVGVRPVLHRLGLHEDAAFMPPKANGPRRRGRLLMCGVILGAGVLGVALFPSATPTPGEPLAASGAGRVAEAVAGAEPLHAGMSMDEVRRVEGDPTRRGEQRWEYGASWVAFDGGVVSDWYSSPWSPLHVATTRMPR